MINRFHLKERASFASGNDVTKWRLYIVTSYWEATRHTKLLAVTLLVRMCNIAVELLAQLKVLAIHLCTNTRLQYRFVNELSWATMRRVAFTVTPSISFANCYWGFIVSVSTEINECYSRIGWFCFIVPWTVLTEMSFNTYGNS